ncbi:hypothetical protein KJ762_11265 [bacterium]|nr:hypothetical protein [bacterium]MBU1065879.1 hypothetical protein [bacterium]MBU1635069.1 hypothetical protein [bacterium]MBU1874478.1 hypothetical protein [bacterium]
MNEKKQDIWIPAMGWIAQDSGMLQLEQSSDGFHRVGINGVKVIIATGDKKVKFIVFEDHTIAHVLSDMDCPGGNIQVCGKKALYVAYCNNYEEIL